MSMEIQVSRNFLDLFYHEIDNLTIDECHTKLNLHVLKIENNKFSYHELMNSLFDSIITYSLSRKEQEVYKNNPGLKYIKAVQKLRDYKSNDGELGEILLYCFLETHLNAPKIFTKLELKTSNNDYVKGSDGVHLLKIDDQNYQLVFGESKLDQKLSKSLYNAFKSINDFITRPNNNINDEIGLLNSHLEKEAITNEYYNTLKKIIIPSASNEEIYKDNAFGIFVGFNIEPDETLLKSTNYEFRQTIRKFIKSEVEEQIDYIKRKINEYKLFGYSFYIYAFPFIQLEEVRKRMIRNLKEASNDF